MVGDSIRDNDIFVFLWVDILGYRIRRGDPFFRLDCPKEHAEVGNSDYWACSGRAFLLRNFIFSKKMIPSTLPPLCSHPINSPRHFLHFQIHFPTPTFLLLLLTLLSTRRSHLLVFEAIAMIFNFWSQFLICFFILQSFAVLVLWLIRWRYRWGLICWFEWILRLVWLLKWFVSCDRFDWKNQIFFFLSNCFI